MGPIANKQVDCDADPRMRRFRSAVLIVSTLALVGLPRTLLAQTPEQPPNGGNGELEQPGGFDVGLLLAGFGLASTAVFGSAEIVIATHYGTWLPPGWAWTQLAVAVPLNAVSGVMVAFDGDTGLAIATLTAAGWFTANSLLSLFLYEPPPDKSASKQRSNRSWWASMASIRGGVAAVGGGQF